MPGRWLLAGALLLVALGPVSTEDAVSVTVSPEVAFEPAWVTVRVYAEPQEDYRVLEVVTESELFYRSSRLQLEGERASRASEFRYRGLPAGEYDIRATILGNDGKERAVAHARLKVHR